MKNILLPTLVILFFVFLLSTERSSAQLISRQKDITGFWQATVEGADFCDIYVYHFFFDQTGKLRGICYAFRNGKKKNETFIDSVFFHGKSVYLKLTGTVEMEYRGYFIASNRTIGGKLFYPDSTSVPWVLKKLAIRSISELSGKGHSK